MQTVLQASRACPATGEPKKLAGNSKTPKTEPVSGVQPQGHAPQDRRIHPKQGCHGLHQIWRWRLKQQLGDRSPANTDPRQNTARIAEPEHRGVAHDQRSL